MLEEVDGKVDHPATESADQVRWQVVRAFIRSIGHTTGLQAPISIRYGNHRWWWVVGRRGEGVGAGGRGGVGSTRE